VLLDPGIPPRQRRRSFNPFDSLIGETKRRPQDRDMTLRRDTGGDRDAHRAVLAALDIRLQEPSRIGGTQWQWPARPVQAYPAAQFPFRPIGGRMPHFFAASLLILPSESAVARRRASQRSLTSPRWTRDATAGGGRDTIASTAFHPAFVTIAIDSSVGLSNTRPKGCGRARVKSDAPPLNSEVRSTGQPMRSRSRRERR
jgi:hypothetical protein